jgi:hypothetical protein
VCEIKREMTHRERDRVSVSAREPQTSHPKESNGYGFFPECVCMCARGITTSTMTQLLLLQLVLVVLYATKTAATTQARVTQTSHRH